jgi:N utilization substance protein A
MLVAFGESGIKTVEDLADCATDDLAGWQERAHGQTKQHPGILQSFNISRVALEQLILNARVAAGWIEAPLPDPAEPEGEQEDSASGSASALGDGEEASHAHPEEKAFR